MRVKGSVTEGNARLEIIMVHGEKALGTVWYRLDISAFVGQVLIEMVSVWKAVFLDIRISFPR